MRTRRFLLLLIAFALPPLAAAAQTATPAGDTAYCAALSALANRYLDSNTGDGRSFPDLPTSTAIQDCEKGNTAAGIPVLEQKLGNNGFTLPKRS